MKIHRDQTWTRRGFTLLWDSDALARMVEPADVISLRQLFALARRWPADLSGAEGDVLVVAGLEGLLDALAPDDAMTWLQNDLKRVMLDFQNEYEGVAALVFWLPAGRKRLTMSRASEEYFWKHSPAREPHLPLGRYLWAGAESDASRILDTAETDPDPDGPAYIGLYHPRIS